MSVEVRPFAVRRSGCIVDVVLVKSRESEAGSQHVLLGRPAFAYLGMASALVGQGLAGLVMGCCES